MNDLAIARLAHQVAVFEHPPHLGIGDLAPGNADLRLDDPGGREPAGQVCHDPLYRLAGHLLGGVHRI